MKSLVKNLAILIIVGLMLYVGYNYFFASNSISLDIGAGSSQGQLLTNEFLIKLNELETINFTGELFNDPRFQSLTSFGSVPPAASAGRANPFTP